MTRDTRDPRPCLLIFGQCLAAAVSDLDPVTRIWVSARPRHVTRDTADICFRIFPDTIFIPDGTGQHVTEHPCQGAQGEELVYRPNLCTGKLVMFR